MLAKFSHLKKYCDCTCSYYNLITQVAGGQSLLPPGSRKMCILSFRQSTIYAPKAFITVSSLEDMISAYLTGLSRVFTSQNFSIYDI